MTSAGESAWIYPHRDLGEHVLPDGSQILRPCVLVSPGQAGVPHLGVVDSGSPITVADPAFLTSAGVDTKTDQPVMSVPFGMGASFGSVPIYEIAMELIPPDSDHRPLTWRALVGARSPWKLPFAVLLGQRGWFDAFPPRSTIRRQPCTLPGRSNQAGPSSGPAQLAAETIAAARHPGAEIRVSDGKALGHVHDPAIAAGIDFATLKHGRTLGGLTPIT